MKRCHLMIFGATGDLTYQKLIPGIFQLYKDGELCEDFQMVCIGRKDIDLEGYLQVVSKDLKQQLEFHNFKKHLEYHKMDFTDESSYKTLEKYDFNKAWIFYLATAPSFFTSIVYNLNNCNYLKDYEGYKRIVFEKPFGVNFQDAKDINTHICEILDEKQIYRIDHYLGKEMIQNILLTRAYNKIIEMLWHKDAIDYIEIAISEKEGVKNRGGYYDHAGALKDMVQNHILQIVALLAMKLPDKLQPDKIREEKTKILKSIRLTDDLVFGQYDNYLKEKDVSIGSKTETFVAAKLLIDDERWTGVPFYIKTGKALKQKFAHMVIHFKENEKPASENVLIIKIQPEEGIYLQMNTKEPGISNQVTKISLDYCHSCLKYAPVPSAYSRLLLDIMSGDKSLFSSWEEIEASWKVIDAMDKIRLKHDLMIYEENSTFDANILLEKGWWDYD
jgi:glucose-6-phosphate 1-dehydrogenase